MNNPMIAVIVAGALIVKLAYAEQSVGAAPLASGIDIQYIDDTVRAQDDFYRHVNGKWLASVEIPADRGRYDAIAQVTNAVQSQLHEIVAGPGNDAAHPDDRKIADLYSSFFDEAALDRLGLQTPDAEISRNYAL